MIPVQNAADVAKELHKACNEVGFFYVSCAVPTSPDFIGPYCLVKWLDIYFEIIQVANHGVPAQTCQNVLKEAHAWFALPVLQPDALLHNQHASLRIAATAEPYAFALAAMLTAQNFCYHIQDGCKCRNISRSRF